MYYYWGHHFSTYSGGLFEIELLHTRSPHGILPPLAKISVLRIGLFPHYVTGYRSDVLAGFVVQLC